ncbi:MAG: SusC/RagA family TonB-linked outer membrane protein [Bacteroidota bacterium]|nr:SusC/RagA family TonB-linked outer membrane protein [Bacteroidota bacterium]
MKTKFTRICTSFVLFFALTLSAYAQQISGTVTDENGVPLPGATVLVQGTSNGVSTDFDGNYSISASQGDTLVFSFVGYSSQSVVVGSSSTVNVSLEPDNALEEVVVTALGVQRNTKALGYSVTNVEGDEISANPSTNAINALQGKVAGVNITGGAMGAKGSSRVVIRGSSSLTGNNQPLYVVDGITINNNNLGAAGMWGGTDFGDGISSINPDDVASVTVLKGGAAAALYGSRASNGVIIITTKNGLGSEGLGIEINSTTQFDMLNTSLWDAQTTYGSGSLGSAPSNSTSAMDNLYSAWGAKMSGQLVPQFDGVSRPYVYSDNKDKYYQTGTTYSNTISFSTANENGNTRFSLTNLDNDDIAPNSTLDRNQIGVNTSQQLGDNLRVDANMKYILEDQSGNPRLSDAPGNANWILNNYAPSVDVNWAKGPNGDGRNDDLSEYRATPSIYVQNPWFASNYYINDAEKERFIGSINARLDLTDFLYIRGRVGADRYDLHRTTSEPYGTGYKPNGGINHYKLAFQQLDADFFLGTDNLSLTDQVSLTAFLGIGSNTVQSESLSINGNDFIVPSLVSINNVKAKSAGYGFSEKQINSAYGSAEFGYNDWAYLTVTARNDWFSTLSLAGKNAPNNDLYTSATLSLVLSDAFDLGDISFLKLRAGYSQVAGGADSPYRLNLTYGIVGQGHLGASLGQINGGQIPNTEITPFEKNETEFGFDIRMLDNRLSLDATYYDNETVGDIVGVSASRTSGFSSALANLGEINNSGVELLLKYKPVVTDDFAMEVSLNYTNNDSKVVATNDTGGNISLQEPRDRNLRVTHIVGERYGALFGTSFQRDSQGRIVHETSRGYPVPVIVNNRKILGFGVPPQQIGIGASFRYKDFNAGFLIEGKSGGQIYSGTNLRLIGYGLHKMTVPAGGREAGMVPDGVLEDGSVITQSLDYAQQQAYWGRYNDAAEAGVRDSDYMRLRQLNIGYNIPSSVLEGTFIQSASVSLIGKNLFFLSNDVENVDPESAYASNNSQGLEFQGLPVPRTIGFNVNLKF